MITIILKKIYTLINYGYSEKFNILVTWNKHFLGVCGRLLAISVFLGHVSAPWMFIMLRAYTLVVAMTSSTLMRSLAEWRPSPPMP